MRRCRRRCRSCCGRWPRGASACMTSWRRRCARFWRLAWNPRISIRISTRIWRHRCWTRSRASPKSLRFARPRAPPVDAVARIAEEFEIRWVRRPFEIPVLRGRFHRVLARHGCRTTDHFAGFQLTGRFRAPELAQLIRELPDGVTEFMCHPGYCGDDLRHARTRLKESRERELEAPVAPEVRAELAEAAVELVNYRGLEGGLY